MIFQVVGNLLYLGIIAVLLVIPIRHYSFMKLTSLSNFEEYLEAYRHSVSCPHSFWKDVAESFIHWNEPFSKTVEYNSETGSSKWFIDGKLNVCYNCVDRHAIGDPKKPAIIWVGDDPNRPQAIITYHQLLVHVSKLANWMEKVAGVRKGDVITIYMPMVPEAVYSMLACARIGALHNVVFGGFSAASLRERIADSKSRLVISADCGFRGGKVIDMKSIVNTAIKDLECVDHVLMLLRCEKSATNGWHSWDEVEVFSENHAPLSIESNDPLFILYTSGSTGKPKGLVHGSGGYLTYASMTSKIVFDLKKDDILATFADVGWITGHSYIVYGPLSNGVTTLLFEGLPSYPGPDRLWNIVDQFNITQIYTAPTVIRMLKKHGAAPFIGKNLSTLKVIGSVGEPINADAWLWYKENVGKNNAFVVDTYWQTETGGHIIAPIPKVTQCKPGSATFPLFGVLPAVLDTERGHEITQIEAQGVLCLKNPWPGMAQTIWQDHKRFEETYFKPFPGYFYTGDRVYRDEEGYYWIRGRADDVINTSAHRLSTAEIENAACKCSKVAEAAALGKTDELIGESIWIFCVVKSEYVNFSSESIEKDVIQNIRLHIGPVATPRKVIIVTDLPKTRSGKIMRRILRKLLHEEYESLGDTSTLNNPATIEEIKEKLQSIKKL